MNKPVALKCIVKGCENHKNEGGFEDGMCLPCYLFITTGEGIYSQAYRNTNPVKELTDEEIAEVYTEMPILPVSNGEVRMVFEFARAILRKAQE